MFDTLFHGVLRMCCFLLLHGGRGPHLSYSSFSQEVSADGFLPLPIHSACETCSLCQLHVEFPLPLCIHAAEMLLNDLGVQGLNVRSSLEANVPPSNTAVLSFSVLNVEQPTIWRFLAFDLVIAWPSDGLEFSVAIQSFRVDFLVIVFHSIKGRRLCPSMEKRVSGRACSTVLSIPEIYNIQFLLPIFDRIQVFETRPFIMGSIDSKSFKSDEDNN